MFPAFLAFVLVFVPAFVLLGKAQVFQKPIFLELNTDIKKKCACEIQIMLTLTAVTVADSLIGSVSRTAALCGSTVTYAIWGTHEAPTFHIIIKDAMNTLDVIEAFIEEKKVKINEHKTLRVLLSQLRINMNFARCVVSEIEKKECIHNEQIFKYWCKIDCDNELSELNCLMRKIDTQFSFMMDLVRTFG